MSEAVKKAYAEYLRIAELFRENDPSAENEWQKFVHADNGWSLASAVVCGVING